MVNCFLRVCTKIFDAKAIVEITTTSSVRRVVIFKQCATVHKFL